MAKSHSGSPRQFTYHERLTREQIRLLKFDTRSDDPANSHFLSLCLFTTSLPSIDNTSSAEPEPYLALSYTWGEKDGQTILINHRPFTPTHNLEHALRQLEGEIVLPIWIDAISINQQDGEEKGRQVERMRDIYSNAQRTIIWLGEGDNSSCQVMRHLDRIGRDAIEAGMWNLEEQDFKDWHNNSDPEKAIIKDRLKQLTSKMGRGYEDRVPFPLSSFIDLSYRPWFRRVWILQELSVSKDYSFMCGKTSIPGDHFIAGFQFCAVWIALELFELPPRESIIWLPLRFSNIWWRNGWSFIRTLGRAFEDKPFMPSPRAGTTLVTRLKVLRKTGMSLMEHLNRAFVVTSDISLDASNPKDRIYALLGVSNDAQQLAITPDYDDATTYQSVYADVARKLIQPGHLGLLCQCRPGRSQIEPYGKFTKDNTLPSWTPDWTKIITIPWGGNLEDHLFKASGPAPFIPSLLNNGERLSNVLKIEAYFVGTIAEAGSVWQPPAATSWRQPFDWARAGIFITEIESYLNRAGMRYTAKEKLEALWRIPVGDKEYNGLGLKGRTTDLSRHEYLDMKTFATSLGTGKTRFRKPKLTSYYTAMSDLQYARPFLSDGGYVGLCPDDSVVSDEIWIPLGSHVPLIFRKLNGGFHELVGESYVHGIMDREIIQTRIETQVLQLI
jgi:hypothetical protein